MERVNARTLFLMFLTTHDLFLFFSLFLCLTVDHSGLVAFVIDAHSLYSLQSSTPLSSLFLLYCTFVQLLLVSCYDDLNTAKIQLYKMVMTLLICVINYAFVKTFSSIETQESLSTILVRICFCHNTCADCFFEYFNFIICQNYSLVLHLIWVMALLKNHLGNPKQNDFYSQKTGIINFNKNSVK